MALLTANEIFEIATRLEQSGESFYGEAAQGTTRASVKALFQELATQEQHHRRAFEQMSGSAVSDILSSEQWDEFQAYADALLQQRFLADPENALRVAAEAKSELDVLRAALGFEQETIAFYEQLHGIVRDAEQQAIQRIIDEEKRHIQRLLAMQAAQELRRE